MTTATLCSVKWPSACVKVCQVAGAIDFTRDAIAQTERFDLVLDLRATPAFSQHAKPQGYLQWDGRDVRALLADSVH